MVALAGIAFAARQAKQRFAIRACDQNFFVGDTQSGEFVY